MSERTFFTLLESAAQDVRYALRILRNNFGFAITSITVLALAIGANTTMFSVLDATLFRPLPYKSPEQLVMLWTERRSQNLHEGRSAFWNVEQWRHQSQNFADIAAFDAASVTLTSSDKTERIGVVRITPNFFSLLGVQPLHGRFFSEEEAGQRQHLVLISHRFWQTRFGGSPHVVGATLVVDGFPCQIVGILPADFQFGRITADIWEPHTMSRDWDVLRAARGSGSWSILGRLRHNVSIEQAQAEMSAIASRLNEELPSSERDLDVRVVPLTLQLTGPRARLALWMLMGAVFCVLLIAITNVAGLSLARSAGRGREIATRAALGASYARIIRQLLVESLTLAVIAASFGFVIAMGGIHLILAFRPADLLLLNEIRLDPQTLAWACALCVVTGVVVGLAPAMTIPRGRRAAAGLGKLRRGLVATQFALAIILLLGAGLLIRSLWLIENVDPGFRVDRVLSAQVSTPASMTIAQRPNFYNRVLEQIESLPGVERAGVIENFFISSSPEQVFTAETGAAAVSGRLRFRSDDISPEFFKTLGVPLLRGRFFSSADKPDALPVAIINDAMARRLWPGGDPIGRRLKPGSRDSNTPWLTIIGVVGDMRRLGLENEAIPQIFRPVAQDPSRLATILIKTKTDDPRRIAADVESAVHRVNKNAPVYGITTLENLLGAFLAQRRFQTSLLVGFSTVALLLAAIGIYGLIQYSIATRTREIGIRIAVGAQASEIFRMILREGLMLSLSGVALGLLGALWLARVVSSLLFGVGAADPLTLTGVFLLLIAVALAACYFPARRAMKIEPIVALRHE